MVERQIEFWHRRNEGKTHGDHNTDPHRDENEFSQEEKGHQAPAESAGFL